MYRRCADLGPGRAHPWAAPASTMTEWQAVRVLGSGGGRRRALRRRSGLTQCHELQGRIHGPAHHRSKRAFGRAAVGHRREHVFVRLRSRSDGNLRTRAGSRGPNSRISRPSAESARAPAIDLAHAPNWGTIAVPGPANGGHVGRWSTPEAGRWRVATRAACSGQKRTCEVLFRPLAVATACALPVPRRWRHRSPYWRRSPGPSPARALYVQRSFTACAARTRAGRRRACDDAAPPRRALARAEQEPGAE